MTSRRRSTGSVRRRDARPRTQFVLQAPQRGECRCDEPGVLCFFELNQSKHLSSYSSSSDVPKMDTRLAGTICRVGNIFAMNVSITTIGGNADRTFTNPLSGQRFTPLFFFTDSHKDGYEIFASWKRVWTSNGKSEPSLKAFMADQQLPYWVNKLLKGLNVEIWLTLILMFFFFRFRFNAQSQTVESGVSSQKKSRSLHRWQQRTVAGWN